MSKHIDKGRGQTHYDGDDCSPKPQANTLDPEADMDGLSQMLSRGFDIGSDPKPQANKKGLSNEDLDAATIMSDAHDEADREHLVSVIRQALADYQEANTKRMTTDGVYFSSIKTEPSVKELLVWLERDQA